MASVRINLETSTHGFVRVRLFVGLCTTVQPAPRGERKPLSKWDLFKALGGYDPVTNHTRFVDTGEFVGDTYGSLKFGNGGSWTRRDTCGNYRVATVNDTGKVRLMWTKDASEVARVEREFRESGCAVKGKGAKLRYVRICGLNDAKARTPPIRDDIRKFYGEQPCVACGATQDLVCDHKNDLYNDEVVLCRTTQTQEHFQSLCNGCNLKKRGASVNTQATGRRYSAYNIPSLKPLGIEFITGGDTFDPSDVNAMVGSYWYDPVVFISCAVEMRIQRALQGAACG